MSHGLLFWRCPKCRRELLLSATPTEDSLCRGTEKQPHLGTPMVLFQLTGSR